MRSATRSALGSLAPPAGLIDGGPFEIAEDRDVLRFQRAGRPADGLDLQAALGSGKYAITYIGECEQESLTEARMTYMPARRAWCDTPGQGVTANLRVGEKHEMGIARKCILCHAVTLGQGSLLPAPEFQGVGCESCHGAGAAHVAAMRAGGKGALAIDDPRKWQASPINAVCSRCHRSLNDVPIFTEDAGQTARYQGYGIELSACYRKSGGRLSCITCHNPHANAPTNVRSYDRACLSCHGATIVNHAAPCPVQPTGGCVPCHMPKRNVFPDQHIPIAMADHLILARRPRK
ncbi:MAG TPA: multiheme c-type cytochrome [Chthonomonadaceae bacterium]|nr:multiheme c-type cytochrome [Chthonomonadaceae bacterium]